VIYTGYQDILDISARKKLKLNRNCSKDHSSDRRRRGRRRRRKRRRGGGKDV
jgi:hypothetical protein